MFIDHAVDCSEKIVCTWIVESRAQGGCVKGKDESFGVGVGEKTTICP